jgi:hypothetical protein
MRRHHLFPFALSILYPTSHLLLQPQPQAPQYQRRDLKQHRHNRKVKRCLALPAQLRETGWRRDARSCLGRLRARDVGPSTGPRLDRIAGVGVVAGAGRGVDVRGVADGEGRGDESEEGEGEVEGVVQQILAVALFEVGGGKGQYRRHKVSCKLRGAPYEGTGRGHTYWIAVEMR